MGNRCPGPRGLAFAATILVVIGSSCVTAADVQRADNEDQLCWMRYRQMVRRDSDTVDGDVRTESRRLSCLALNRKLERIRGAHEDHRREQNDRTGPSGGEVAVGIFQVLGTAMGGAAAAGRASQPTSTTCNTTSIGGTLQTTCNSQ